MNKYIYMILISLSITCIHAGIPTKTTDYHRVTEMLIARESWEQIEPILIEKRKIPPELFPFFNTIAGEEEWGHIGYHGANHGFRFYQDVIKFTIEEVLHIPIRDDFQFLRWPGDADLNLNSVTEFIAYWEKNGEVNNRDKRRAKQLLSMNYGIYSNFDVGGSCSVGLFSHDKSAAAIDYVEELVPFYEKIGIHGSRANLQKMLDIFNRHLNVKSGILLQISENSHLTHPENEAYNFADKQCYPAVAGGARYDYNLVSDHYKTAMTEAYINKVANISAQIRLVINNQHTLNPFSPLKIKRWDRQNPAKIVAYENAMRTAIRKLKYNKTKWMQYQELLKKSWKPVKKGGDI